MDKAIVVDTDVMVDLLRGHPAAVALTTNLADRMVLASIVVAELYAGARGPREEAEIAASLSAFRLVPLTAEIARAAGLLKRDYGKSHGVSLADAIVAATLQSENAELVTCNVRHYPMLKGLEPAYPRE